MLLFSFQLLLSAKSNEVKCFSLIKEHGENYNIDAYYFFNLRQGLSTIYIRGKAEVNGKNTTLDRRLDFVTKYYNGNNFIFRGEAVLFNTDGGLDGVDINTFIPLMKNIRNKDIIFDAYKQLDGSFIIQKTNGQMIYCNI